MKLLRKVGVTSEIWQVFIRDSSSTTGAGLTALAYNTSNLVAYYHRDTDTTATAISLADMTVGTFTSSGFKKIDDTNMPGWYQFCPPNAALASGAKSCAFLLKGASNMAPLAIEVDLQGDVNVTHAAGTAVTLDVNNVLNVSAKYWAGTAITATSIPVATAAGAAGGLFIAGTNAATTVTTSFTTTFTGNLTGSVGSVTTVNDKTGYSLTQSFPSNFASFAITAAGKVTVGTNDDKTGYSLSQSFPSNFASLSITAGGLVDITQTAADKAWGTAARTLTAGTNIVLPSNALGSITTWTVDITGDILGRVLPQ